MGDPITSKTRKPETYHLMSIVNKLVHENLIIKRKFGDLKHENTRKPPPRYLIDFLLKDKAVPKHASLGVTKDTYESHGGR